MIAIMELSQQQLSKQDHYDYGLRSFVIPIARAAGNTVSFAMYMCFSAPAVSLDVLFLRYGALSQKCVCYVAAADCMGDTVFLFLLFLSMTLP